MDKYEFQIKTEQLEKLLKKGDYETAAKIADSIDWRKVRNVGLLLEVAEAYEKTERYEDCYEILNIAYDCAPIGRMIVYKMTETAVKMKDFDDAVELYKEFMGDIAEEIERENKIITDLLSLVKMDKKAASLNIAPVDINDLLELILKRLRPIASGKNIEMVLESFRPVTAEVDEGRLTLAFTNLVENAIKYNKENGWVHVSLDADHKFFYVKIMDSGMGIPEESLDFIFERFYRVDKSHSSEIDGTGLGLAIAKSAVLVHKGAIKVSSQLGEGTTFSVRIPLNYIA